MKINTLDIVMPVYNEGENIVATVKSLLAHVKTPFRLLICYDNDHDNTLSALQRFAGSGLNLVPVKNRGQGALGAILTGFAASSAPAVLMMPADDDYNAPRIDSMVDMARQGAAIVCPSRFMRGGNMLGCPWFKATLVRGTAWFMYYVVGVPTHDPTNGFRLFSRQVLDRIPIESPAGFAYSIELLVKCHRLGWRISEVPVQWHERKQGTSRFRILKWAPHYLRWVNYALQTRFLRRGPATVRLNHSVVPQETRRRAAA
jgi:glycosyltransferase involved in cell wall biosynthesis